MRSLPKTTQVFIRTIKVRWLGTTAPKYIKNYKVPKCFVYYCHAKNAAIQLDMVETFPNIERIEKRNRHNLLRASKWSKMTIPNLIDPAVTSERSGCSWGFLYAKTKAFLTPNAIVHVQFIQTESEWRGTKIKKYQQSTHFNAWAVQGRVTL